MLPLRCWVERRSLSGMFSHSGIYATEPIYSVVVCNASGRRYMTPLFMNADVSCISWTCLNVSAELEKYIFCGRSWFINSLSRCKRTSFCWLSSSLDLQATTRILQTFTVTSEHIRFYFLVFCFTLLSCRFRAVDEVDSCRLSSAR